MPRPKTNVAQSELPDHVQKHIEAAVAGGLGELTLRDLLGVTFSSVGDAERALYLGQYPADKGNGHYDRSLQLGSIPLEVQVPRVRSGTFRPSFLPARYQRGYPEETQALLLGLLAASRSVGAAKAALKKMGLSHSESELDTVAQEFIEAVQLRNESPIDPDLLALFIDGKYIELRDGDRIKPACLYVVVGLGRDGRKRILAIRVFIGRENLEDWKKVLRGLIERGLRRVMTVVQDDFSGLLSLTQGLFPHADIQLCIVHMQRNAKSHLSKDDAQRFTARLREIKACWDVERAQGQFDDLCAAFEEHAPTFISGLKKKRDHYLKFLSYPHEVRRTFSTTNAVETVCGQLERMRRNNGGYFHSEDILNLKLGITIDYLEEGRWHTSAATIRATLHQLNAMFERRFESAC
jgi:transposase-like protein